MGLLGDTVSCWSLFIGGCISVCKSVHYPAEIGATWSAWHPPFVPSLTLPFLLSPLSPFPFFLSHTQPIPSSSLISIPPTTSSPFPLIPPALTIYSVKRTNETLMNDEGELSCDHKGYIVIESTSDLGYSLILGPSSCQPSVAVLQCCFSIGFVLLV